MDMANACFKFIATGSYDDVDEEVKIDYKLWLPGRRGEA